MHTVMFPDWAAVQGTLAPVGKTPRCQAPASHQAQVLAGWVWSQEGVLGLGLRHSGSGLVWHWHPGSILA